MSYSYSYISTTPRYHEPGRYSTNIHIETPGLSYYSSHYNTESRSSRPNLSAYTARDEQYYNYHRNYCYGAGPSYPAYSTNWEPNRAAPHRLYRQRIKVQSARSRSGSRQLTHHHPPHHHHHHDYVRVLRETWDRMVERETALDKTNKGLVCEVNNLKKGLSAAQAEAHRLGSVVIPQLECQVANLNAENQALRRELQNTTGNCGRHHAEIEALRIRISHQDKEIKDLKCEKANLERRVEELLRQIHQHRGSGCGGGCSRRIEELIRDVTHWKDKFFDMQDRRNALSDLADTQERKIRAYEDILRRNGFICP
ncbi:hypothetical protein NLG97_g660 [Lecanicillium saksenae]|uniref:Uncharacterized protein n=1 Tax=Lecanicillium saksenae TaxID=468837 RepID=A0ACC1R7Q1_9HYPO|nr:hypothetical protein NLG97_g660 [Lecanicillium saksenae]